ncbi:MAG: DUF2752 domain-containing protein [Alistipes sp.]|nr:DUF2752 domain-containing protein [Alistipes sp.]
MAIAKKYKYLTYAIMATILVAVIVYMYYQYDPSYSSLAPKCIVRQLTGYDCPSCGIQRAIHSLLHLDVERAFWLNPFIFVVAPYIVLLILTTLCKGKVFCRMRQYVQRRVVVYSYIALYFIWWVVRNTDWWHSLAVV